MVFSKLLFMSGVIIFIAVRTIEGTQVENSKNIESTFIEEKNSEINLFINELGGKYLTSDELTIESRPLDSTEGGEIVRYKEKNGNILRYRIKRYGETRSVEEDYYFITNDYIYYTRLDEIYNAPMNVGKTIDILYKTFDEGIIIDGKICYYDKSNIVTEESDITKIQYTNLKELNNLFDSFESIDKEDN